MSFLENLTPPLTSSNWSAVDNGPATSSSGVSSTVGSGSEAGATTCVVPPQATTLPMRTATVMMLVATPLTMQLSLGQNRFCYICRGSRDSEGYVFTETLSSISCLSRDRSTRNIFKLSARF